MRIIKQCKKCFKKFNLKAAQKTQLIAVGLNVPIPIGIENSEPENQLFFYWKGFALFWVLKLLIWLHRVKAFLNACLACDYATPHNCSVKPPFSQTRTFQFVGLLIIGSQNKTNILFSTQTTHSVGWTKKEINIKIFNWMNFLSEPLRTSKENIHRINYQVHSCFMIPCLLSAGFNSKNISFSCS